MFMWGSTEFHLVQIILDRHMQPVLSSGGCALQNTHLRSVAMPTLPGGSSAPAGADHSSSRTIWGTRGRQRKPFRMQKRQQPAR